MIKEFFKSLIFITLPTLLLASCGSDNKSTDGYTDTYTEGTIPIAVDESLRPIVDLEIEVFEALNVAADIKPIYCSEVEAINLLLQDKVRVAITTRALSKQEMKVFEAKKYTPRMEVMAVDGVALITNEQNRDSTISVSQIRKILTGEITHWKQLNSASKLGEIQLVFDNTNSSTVRYAQDSICKGTAFAKKRIFAQKTNKDVFDFVSKTPNAVGVIGVSWLDNSADTTRTSFRKGVRVMEVCQYDPVDRQVSYKPYQAYLALKHYPLTRDLYVLCSDPRMALSTNFAAFLTGERGQRIILKSGLVPATQQVMIRSVSVKN